MGYYTNFSLAIVEGQVDEETFLDTLKEVTEYTWYDEGGYYAPGDSIKWYDFNKHMQQLTKMYPDVVFRLRGDGEERGDIWQIFYKNNKTSSWTFGDGVYPEYDVLTLK